MMEKHLGVTGSREPLKQQAIQQILPVLRFFRDQGYGWMHNGDCMNADHLLACAWRLLGGKIHLHPPSAPGYRAWFDADETEIPMEYMKRNQSIVDASACLLAMPKDMHETMRSGTWATVRRALKSRISVYVIWPDGNHGWL